MSDPFTYNPADYEDPGQQDQQPLPQPQQQPSVGTIIPPAQAQQQPSTPQPAQPAPAPAAPQFDPGSYFDPSKQRESPMPGTEPTTPGILDNIAAAALGFAEDFTYQWGDDALVAGTAHIRSYLDGKEPDYKGHRALYDWMQRHVVRNSDPGWYEWGGFAGALMAPGARYLSPIGIGSGVSTKLYRAMRKVPSLRRWAPVARELPSAGTTMGIVGLGEADPVGNDWEDTKSKIMDMQLPFATVTSAILSRGTNVALKSAAKLWRRFKASSHEIRSKIWATMGNMNLEIAEKVFKNPEGVDPLTVKTAEDFSYKAARNVAELRYVLADKYDEIFGLLDDQPVIPVQDIRNHLNKTLQHLENRAYFREGSIAKHVRDFKKELDNGLDQIELERSEGGMISTYTARDMLSLFTKEFSSFKFGGDKPKPSDALTAGGDFYRSFRAFVHRTIERELANNPDQQQARKAVAMYKKLKVEVWHAERLYYDMAADMKLKVPTLKPLATENGVRRELNERMLDKKNAGLVPEPLKTTQKLGGFPLKEEKDIVMIHLEELDDILGLRGKDSLAKELEFVRINFRNRRGETNGSRNTNAYAIAFGGLGTSAGTAMGGVPGGIIGGGIGSAMGAVAGFIVDKHGRRWAKNAIVKLGKAKGNKYEGYPYKTAPSILLRLHELGKDTTDKIMDHIRANRHTAAINLMLNAPADETGWDREDRVRFSAPIDPSRFPQ